MIRIRYKDFSAGTHEATWLHGRTERGDRGVTVYLVPGLTAWQRRAVIRRLRQEASRGFGPALPLHQLVLALGLDRVRTAARVAGSIVRLHPAAALVPSGLVVGLMTLFVVASAGGAAATPELRGGPGGAVTVAGVAGPAVADGPVTGPSLAWMARAAAAPVAVAAAALATVPGAGPQAQPGPAGETLRPMLPSLGQPARPASWYACAQPASAQVGLAAADQPVRPCSSPRAEP
ncbi:MAG TPA: hypothetical protein VGM12_23230 [Trebonia sp.]